MVSVICYGCATVSRKKPGRLSFHYQRRPHARIWPQYCENTAVPGFGFVGCAGAGARPNTLQRHPRGIRCGCGNGRHHRTRGRKFPHNRPARGRQETGVSMSEKPGAFNDSREILAAAIVAGFEKLNPETRGCAVPTIERVRDLLQRVTTTKVTRQHRTRCADGHAWRFLSKPRGHDETAAVFLNRFRWHTGRGSAGLWTLYYDAARVPRETFEFLDTAAAVVAHFAGRLDASHSIATWQRILDIKTETGV